VRDIFRKAKQASPCIIFFDEIEALVPVRDESSDSHVSERVLSQFLSEMDGIEELKGVLVLGATNRVDRVDPAMLRPGRFEEIIEIPPPEEDSRRQIFEVHLRGKPLGEGISASALAARAAGFSGAEVESVCRRAALHAVRRAVEGGKEDPERTAGVLIEAADVEAALEELERRS
jgi:transitional endoplasmic reticulum ATPase